MPSRADASGVGGYFRRIGAIVGRSLARLIRAPDHSRRQQARRAMARRWLVLTAIAAIVITVSMFVFDVTAIRAMPARGSSALWPVRILTDFAKTAFVLMALAALLAVVVALLPRLSSASRPILAAFGIRVQYLFFSVLVATILSEGLKALVGRARPFVGGDASAFNFSPFAHTEAFASFPSGHAVTAFALAFAVWSAWPRLAIAMGCYAVAICVSRVVLLAHHPSDVVAGALVGIVGAMVVRYWFAARRLGFKVRNDGTIVPLQGPSANALKRVAREAFAP